MKIEFIVSTMNRTDLSFIDKMFVNIDVAKVRILAVNQCTTIPVPINNLSDRQNIRVISIDQKGLSRSRNVALENATGELCVLADSSS